MSVREQLRPLHERALQLQDQCREASAEMNRRFAADGLVPFEAYTFCEQNVE